MSKGTRFRRKKSIKNWREYNQGLKRRYDLTVWVSEEALAKPERKRGQKGRPKEYSDGLIELGITLKALYKLSYRGTQGLMESIMAMTGRRIRMPDYTTLNRRSAALETILDLCGRGHRIHLVVDTTGLKVHGEGEWKVRQHGYSKRRTWRKLHLGVDERTQEIVVSDLTENNVGDQEHLPALLDAVPEHIHIKQVSADGIYDTYDCYDAVTAKGAKLITPPRKNAVLPPADAPPHPRHKAIRDCQKMGRKRWKKKRRYHRRSLSETAMYRYKITFGGNLAAREMPYQKAEAAIKVKALNKLRNLAAPAYA